MKQQQHGADASVTQEEQARSEVVRMVVFDDRTEMEVLDRATCFSLLRAESVGRVAFCDADETSVIPVNYAIDQDRVVFRTAGGAKLSAAIGGSEVAFEIDGVDEDARTGWSVIVHGVMTIVSEPDDVEHLQELGLRPWARAPKENWVAIHRRRTSGRRIMTVADQNRVGPYERVKSPPGSPMHWPRSVETSRDDSQQR
jgi:nitroimidazol reductase NimA-like FMN-containing flavoprotein (pyridoxamine 5'-phosphate oxidase superfamily)